MSETDHDPSRRTVLKQAAVGGVGLVASGTLVNAASGEQAIASIEQVDSKDQWFAQRVFFVSGNKLLKTRDGSVLRQTTLARQIYRPRSAQEIAELVKDRKSTRLNSSH